MYRIRQQDLPFQGISHEFVGTDPGPSWARACADSVGSGWSYDHPFRCAAAHLTPLLHPTGSGGRAVQLGSYAGQANRHPSLATALSSNLRAHTEPAFFPSSLCHLKVFDASSNTDAKPPEVILGNSPHNLVRRRGTGRFRTPLHARDRRAAIVCGAAEARTPVPVLPVGRRGHDLAHFCRHLAHDHCRFWFLRRRPAVAGDGRDRGPSVALHHFCSACNVHRRRCLHRGASDAVHVTPALRPHGRHFPGDGVRGQLAGDAMNERKTPRHRVEARCGERPVVEPVEERRSERPAGGRSKDQPLPLERESR
jgi:hypothetical protein